MLIQAYGLFYRRDEVNWAPGKGNGGQFRLLGRIGENRGTIRIADFREQRGIYILYGNHGPHYVGLTTQQSLGKRLKDHLEDVHKDMWDRFCWFGFRKVLVGKDDAGLQRLKEMAKVGLGRPSDAIRDIEALLIRAMALKNVKNMKFTKAVEWHQVKLDEIKHYMAKL